MIIIIIVIIIIIKNLHIPVGNVERGKIWEGVLIWKYHHVAKNMV